MARKNSRPAARKQQAILKAKMENRKRFARRARPILTNPHFGDGALLAALAACIIEGWMPLPSPPAEEG